MLLFISFTFVNYFIAFAYSVDII